MEDKRKKYRSGTSSYEFAICLFIFMIMLSAMIEFIFWSYRDYSLNQYTHNISRQISIQGGICENDGFRNTISIDSLKSDVERLSKDLALKSIKIVITGNGIDAHNAENDILLINSMWSTIVTYDNGVITGVQNGGAWTLQYGGVISIYVVGTSSALMNNSINIQNECTIRNISQVRGNTTTN